MTLLELMIHLVRYFWEQFDLIEMQRKNRYGELVRQIVIRYDKSNRNFVTGYDYDEGFYYILEDRGTQKLKYKELEEYENAIKDILGGNKE